jgi:hypothetical protein
VTQPTERPLIRTRLASADLRVAWEENAAAFVAWARKPGQDSYWQFHRDLFCDLLLPPGRKTLGYDTPSSIRAVSGLRRNSSFVPR